MRAALLTLLVAAPAHAGVVGDMTGGLGLDESHGHIRLGLRGGYEVANVALLAGADWAYAGDEPGADTPVEEHRLRIIGLLGWSRAVGEDAQVALHGGGGLELERSRTIGMFPGQPDRMNAFGDYIVEVGAAYLVPLGSARYGLELAAGHSAINGIFVDVRVVVHFER